MCTLFNGIDQGLLSTQAFSHYSRFIHVFLGNDAHTPIAASLIFFLSNNTLTCMN